MITALINSQYMSGRLLSDNSLLVYLSPIPLRWGFFFWIFLHSTGLKASSASLPAWSVNPSEFQFSMQVIARLNYSGMPVAHQDARIGVFTGNSLRGVGTPLTINGTDYFFITVYSNSVSGEILNFRAYYPPDDQVYGTNTSTTFLFTKVLGSVANPFVVNIDPFQDFAPELLPMGADTTLQGIPFDNLNLDDYLVSADSEPVSWGAVAGMNLQATIMNGMLNVAPSPGWYGTDSVLVTATEVTTNQYSASRYVRYTVLQDYGPPVLSAVSPQIIYTGNTFVPLELDDYLSFNGTDYRYSYDVFPYTGSDTMPNWSAVPSVSPAMKLVIRPLFANHQFSGTGSRLAVFVNNTLAGIGTQSGVPPFAAYTVWVQNVASGSISIRYYDDENDRLYQKNTSINFVPGASLGSVAVPYELQFSPLVPSLSADNKLGVAIADPAWNGVFPVNIMVEDTRFPDDRRDTIRALFSVITSPVTPVFTSDTAVSVQENSCLQLYDAESGDAFFSEGNGIAYSLAGGSDVSRFSIDTLTGVLSWKTFNPDFEAPGDNNADNIYQVTIVSSNPLGLSDSLDLAVIITDNVMEVFGAQITFDTDICAGESTALTASGGSTYAWSGGLGSAPGITVSPSVTTTYTVVVTDVNGCTDSETATVTVNTLPKAMISGGTTICDGESALLTASSASSYLWSTGETTMTIVVSPFQITTYTVTVTNSTSCSSSADTSIDVIGVPSISGIAPIVGTIGSLLTITGINFTGTSRVKLNGVNCPAFTVESTTQISVNMPFSGVILNGSVTAECGTADISTSVPGITSFSPSSGAPGTMITVTGSNLTNVSSVTIDGKPQLVLSNTSNSVLVFLMPSTVTGKIVVTTNSGSATSTGSFTVSGTPIPQIQQGTKKTGAGSAPLSLQGQSVAVSADGNTAVVGAPNDNSNRGGAWIFVRSGNTWTQQGAKLVGTGATGAAKQGYSVAISADGNTVAVGGNLDNLSNGAVWIFTRTGISWAQQGDKLKGIGNVGFAQLGSSVSMSADGNTIAVGGIADNSYKGATWIFTRFGGVWNQQGAKLAGTGAVGAARQGCSVALSSDGQYLVAGGYNDNTRQGAFWVFNRAGNTWTQQGSKLTGTGGSLYSYLGYSVAINADGTTVITGGPNDGALAGATWIFTRSGSAWSQQGGKLTGTGGIGSSRQGGSVAISADGNTAVCGGFADASNAGAMWIYKRTGSTWAQQNAKLTGSNATGSAKQGTSIALCSVGTTVILGGPTDASNQGAVWVFVAGTNIFSFPPTENHYREVGTTVDFVLYPNTPNPSDGRFSIDFSIPEDCVAEWIISDMSGRVVLSQKRDYTAGMNQEQFHLQCSPGVYCYRLKTPFGTKTGKHTVVVNRR